MMLESFKHEFNSFVTLTYAPEFQPFGGTLVPRDLRLFIMRLRSRIAPKKLRFYACGEYGDSSGRPHYHLAIFGLGPDDEPSIRKAWEDPKSKLPIGHVHVGTLTFDSAQYLAKYIQKGLNKKGSPELGDKHPEFSRMSNRPGIAALAVEDLSNALTTDAGAELLLNQGDVPKSLKHGKRSFPLGRYLRSKLREHVGLDAQKIKEENFKKWNQNLLSLLEEASRTSKTAQEYQEKARDVFSHKQKILSIETKAKIFNKRSKL